ncbi:Exodeoxyribonuclease 7 large subunit [Anaerohalosphaera lusitana]|uniref:Exodeoxyribonuclease 7 large subunit n=1 Tax=Anaerohalosphaera lusitana TaxID=1936003 RepID=A0A1U9NP93_9BACT|nr:exodeoxyribonuclease VII large subunit [Anaerohalosphaera lusitana]AQT69741.1 Exodeoxyribonuclease 7 large subunit [Anaerohalosphaera lusitana]
MAKKQKKIYSVSEVNAIVKMVLEANLPPRLTISAEISGWKHHRSGHCYFSLKDPGGIIPCVMWRSNFAKTKFRPEDGMAVLATGYVDVYERGGKYQFYAERMEPAGVGQLQVAFEQMVKRLTEEGLFADEHKKPIPKYPMRIGVMTSESGAAVRDISDSIYNRWPCAELTLFPVPVQGEGAAAKIADAIREVNRRNDKLNLDVLIIGRGGGSLEDLWQFNEEAVARAIYDSQVPIISAVGHEVDVTIADLVADARASTPTKAGVIAVPDVNEVMDALSTTQKRLAMSLRSRLDLARQQLHAIQASVVFRRADWTVNQSRQLLDETTTDLVQSMQGRLAGHRAELDLSRDKIRQIEPHRLLGRKQLHLESLSSSLRSSTKEVIAKRQLQMTAIENKLSALDPKAVLKRGYSMTVNDKTGKVVTNSADAEIGDRIVTELASREKLTSTVKTKQETSRSAD